MIQSNPDNFRDLRKELTDSKLCQAVETLLEARTLTQVDRVYSTFLRLTDRVPVMLQHDYRQFTYPFFVHLALQLFNVDKQKALTFIERYRGWQPQECQDIIDQLVREQSNFQPPQFDIQITQFTFDDLLRKIEGEKLVLLSFIINSYINIHLAPYNHDLLFVSVSDAAAGPRPILNPVEVDMKPLSVLFHGKNLGKAPGIHETDDNKLFLTQALPDVAQFVAYNHGNRISDMRVSPCARLLSMAIDSNVLVYRLDTAKGLTTVQGKRTANLISHAGRVLTTAFSHDSRYVISGGMDCEIRVAETEAFRPLAHFKFHTGPILNVGWDYRAGYFLSASQDMLITMWSLGCPNCLRCFFGHSLPVCKAIFSRDNSSVISCSSDLTVRIWDVGKGEQRAEFRCGKSMPLALDIDPRNTLLACGCRDGSVIIWDAVSGQHKWTGKLFESSVTDVKFSADGNLLFSTSLEGQFCGVSVESEEPSIVMNVEANAATMDSITVTERNLVLTTGRSRRGGVLI